MTTSTLARWVATRPRPERLAIALAWATVAYNVVEGIVAVGFGIGAESMALLGFGLDSWIEVGSALLVLWRLALPGALGQAREKRATWWIGALLVALAGTVTLGSAWRLWEHEGPDSSLPGAIVATLSLSFMVVLWRTKLAVAERIGSATLRADAACSRSCVQLSVVLLAGSALATIAPGWWWVDAVAAIVLAGLIAREGWATMAAARRPEPTVGCGGCC